LLCVRIDVYGAPTSAAHPMLLGFEVHDRKSLYAILSAGRLGDHSAMKENRKNAHGKKQSKGHECLGANRGNQNKQKN
jgi:hypothetical protein